MASKVGPRARYGNSRRCDSVDGSLQAVTDAASPDAAHQRARHTERRFLDMIRTFARAGAVTRIERLRVLFEDAARVEPICTDDGCLLVATDSDFHADATQDAARYDFLRDLTPATEARLLRCLYAEIGAKQAKAAILEARKEARRV